MHVDFEPYLRVGSSREPHLQASKWLQVQFLVDVEEMAELLAELGKFYIYRAGVVCAQGESHLKLEAFLKTYGDYIAFLKEGITPPDALFRSIFSSIWTLTTDPLFVIPVNQERHIVRVSRPVVQLQLHKMAYSTIDGKFRAMVFGPESINWGLQISYPQLFREASTGEIYKTLDKDLFPNSILYKGLQRWLRRSTIPTPFQVDGRKVNVPIRLGKRALSWINQHPQLISQGLSVTPSSL